MDHELEVLEVQREEKELSQEGQVLVVVEAAAVVVLQGEV